MATRMCSRFRSRIIGFTIKKTRSCASCRPSTTTSPVNLRRIPSSPSRASHQSDMRASGAATQIDPLWNAYLLALVIEIAPDLEAARVPRSDNVAFSYRFRPSTKKATLFDADLGWGSFQRTALEKAEDHDVILSTDISDFYPRIYHHRLENALNDATQNIEVVRRILFILAKLTPGEVSFGLPVGGHAARVLAEILLNRTDRLLQTDGINYCRFVDDYYIFADSRHKSQAALIHLSEVLTQGLPGGAMGRP